MPFVIIGIIAVIVVIALLYSCVEIVPESECYIVEYLGEYIRTMGKGVNFKLPIVEKVVKKVCLQEQTINIPPQGIITKDNITMQIDAVVCFKVSDARKFAYGVSNPV